MGFFFALRTLHLVQNFVALIDSRSCLLLASKAQRIFHIAYDPPVFKTQFRREIKLGCHGAGTPSSATSSVVYAGLAEPAVPIRLLLEHDHAFTPEDVKILVEAFEDTLHALGLVDREDPLTMTVAKLIIEFAKEGERDPARLRTW